MARFAHCLALAALLACAALVPVRGAYYDFDLAGLSAYEAFAISSGTINPVVTHDFGQPIQLLAMEARANGSANNALTFQVDTPLTTYLGVYSASIEAVVGWVYYRVPQTALVTGPLSIPAAALPPTYLPHIYMNGQYANFSTSHYTAQTWSV